jgi:uncharacterized membrane protein
MAEGVPLTFDGMAYMRAGSVVDGDPSRDPREIPLAGDYYAIRWIQENVEGSPVIMEGNGHREYLWGNRVSIYTGLPAVVGWRWHQVQQRPLLPDFTVDARRRDVEVFYETSDITYAETILDRYGVRYIYLGDYERAYYSVEGLAKLDQMVGQGLLRVVYDALGVTIYEVVRDSAVIA